VKLLETKRVDGLGGPGARVRAGGWMWPLGLRILSGLLWRMAWRRGERIGLVF
jgi:hypothetical protein